MVEGVGSNIPGRLIGGLALSVIPVPVSGSTGDRRQAVDQRPNNRLHSSPACLGPLTVTPKQYRFF